MVWHKVCESKDKGGLGVIDIRKFKLALLRKWIWRLKFEKEKFMEGYSRF